MRKRRNHILLLITFVSAFALFSACSSPTTEDFVIDDTNDVSETMNTQIEILDTETEESLPLETSTSEVISETETPSEALPTEAPATETEATIPSIPSEVEKNDALEQLIKEYYEIPEGAEQGISYMYNYIDLDQDGTNEILAMLSGAYSFFPTGTSLVYLSLEKDPTSDTESYTIMQSFPDVSQPVIISSTATNGMSDIIIGSPTDTDSYLKLMFLDDSYSAIDQAEHLSSLESVSGTVILSNDIMQDREDGAALFF